MIPTQLGGDGTSVRAGVVILDHHRIIIPRKMTDVGLDYGTLADLADMGRLDPEREDGSTKNILEILPAPPSARTSTCPWGSHPA